MASEHHPSTPESMESKDSWESLQFNSSPFWAVTAQANGAADTSVPLLRFSWTPGLLKFTSLLHFGIVIKVQSFEYSTEFSFCTMAHPISSPPFYPQMSNLEEIAYFLEAHFYLLPEHC